MHFSWNTSGRAPLELMDPGGTGSKGHQDIWVKDIWVLDTWVLDTWVQGHMGTRTYGYQDIWVQGHMGTGTYGYQDIWVLGHMGTGTYGYNSKQDIWVQLSTILYLCWCSVLFEPSSLKSWPLPLVWLKFKFMKYFYLPMSIFIEFLYHNYRAIKMIFIAHGQ